MDRRFDRVDARFEARFDAMDRRFDATVRAILVLAASMFAAMASLVAAVILTL
jgi:hypothetical protein